MKSWLIALNPLAKIDTVAEALTAARASSVTLWLSGAKWVAAAILMIGDMPRLKAEMATGASSPLQNLVGAGMTEAMVGITAAIGLFQVILGVVHWRAPNTFIPIIFLILSVYGLGGAVWNQAVGNAGSGWPMLLSYFTLVVAVLFHWIGLRGAARLEKLHRVR
ncbi:MAG: hypothetical protein V4707_09015 [Pseudomonadota bacterium]